MTDLASWEGKHRWIEARARALVRVRGMFEGEALAKAKEEFAHFAALDRHMRPQDESTDQ